MKSIYFEVSIPKIIITKLLSRFFPAICFSRFSPVALGEFPDQDLPGPSWVRVESFITHRFPLNEYKKAFRLLRRGSETAIKVIFEIGQERGTSYG